MKRASIVGATLKTSSRNSNYFPDINKQNMDDPNDPIHVQDHKNAGYNENTLSVIQSELQNSEVRMAENG